jgi:uncharacterized phage protein gp47/JayE
MTVYGITATGFVKKPLDQIIADLRTTLQATFGAGADLSDTGPFGQLVANLAQPVSDVWDLAEVCVDLLDPDGAQGPQLAALCGLTGTVPVTPTYSTGTLYAVGTAGSAVPTNFLCHIQGGTSQFRVTAGGVIAALTAWASHTAVAGELRTNGGNAYLCTVGGATAGAGGPTTTALDIVDGAAHWRFLGVGTAAVALPIRSVDLGAVAAVAGSLTSIDTPTAGVTSITNATDVTLGVAIESDAALRLRREEELRAQGEGGVDSIRALLLETTGVTDARVFENTTDATDGSGRPPHSVEAVALGGTDAAVAAAVFTRGAGIQTFGTSTANVTDKAGNVHAINFSRPTAKLVYVTVNVTKETDASLPQYPSDGDSQIKAALVNFATGQLPELFRGYRIGDPLITSKLYAAIEGVSGVRDVTAIFVGLAPAPGSSANLAAGSKDLMQLDTSRITVVSV